MQTRAGLFCLAQRARSGEGEHAIVAKKTGASRTTFSGGSGPRGLAWTAVGLLVASLGLAGLDLVRERQRAIESGDAALQERARVADALHQADEARIHALLARLRIELRSTGDWTRLGAEGDAASDPAAARQRDTLLRRALEGTDDVRAVDLLVAGPKGLVAVRVEPDAGPPVRAVDGEQSEARAKALWYADEVQEAVAANGRRVTRGDLRLDSTESGPGATVQTVLALHDADEVIQGVLVATVDLVPLANRLGSLSAGATRFALVAPDGQLVGSPSQAPTGPIGALLGEGGLAFEAPTTVVAGDGVRSLLMPASRTDEGPVELAYWLERDAPPALARAAVESPWLAAWAALTLLAGAAFAWDRDRSRSREETGLKAVGTPRAAAVETRAPRAASKAYAAAEAFPLETCDADAESGEAPVRPERIVLRDWLADVRGCLEREAATRGLTLDLRCERSLPREFQQDPLWLGGLLVSLGREALDATSASRVALEVTENEGARLRFELDAGDTELEPVPGMRVIAERLGATLEGRGRGRISVVVPALPA
jgi:hypothetical protein